MRIEILLRSGDSAVTGAELKHLWREMDRLADTLARVQTTDQTSATNPSLDKV